MKKTEQSLTELWDTIKNYGNHMCIMEALGEENQGQKNIWRNNDWKAPRYDEIDTNPGNSVISK
jgi:hypothetical protein